MIEGLLENTPIRTIIGKAELLGGSATYVKNNGDINISDISPVPHTITVKTKSDNLIDLSKITATAGYGTTEATSPDRLVVHPPASGNIYALNISQGIEDGNLEPGKTYTFSMDFCSQVGSSWGWRIKKVDGTWMTTIAKAVYTVEWKEEYTAMSFYIGFPLNTTSDVIVKNLQVREASEVLPFVPYVDTSEVLLSASGRNKFRTYDYELIGANMDSYCRDGILGRVAKTGITTSYITPGTAVPIGEICTEYLEPGEWIFTAEWVSIPNAYKNKIIYLQLLDNGEERTLWNGESIQVHETDEIIITAIRCESVSVKNGETMACRLMLQPIGTGKIYPYEEFVGYGGNGSTTFTSFGTYLDIVVDELPENASVEVCYQKANNTTFAANGELQDFTIDRVGANKFFGFGVSQKATINLLDKERKHDINGAFVLSFDDKECFPWFYVEETKRNENTNAIEVIAYDALGLAEKHSVKEIKKNSYTIVDFLRACGKLLGVEVVYPGAVNEFNLQYKDGANFNGDETIREALTAIAEATQTVYFMNKDNKLVFLRLDKYGDAVYTVDKSQYYTLTQKPGYTLERLVSATELGEDYETGNPDGTTQHIRNNPFWELRDDITTLVDNALAVVKDTTFIPFECKWRGNYLVEPFDKIAFINKDDTAFSTYLINDKITYNGAYSQTSSWTYEEESKTSANPTSLGEAIKQTYAKVDKINKDITLVASEVEANKNNIASIQMNTESITASVSSLRTAVEASAEATNNAIIDITNKVNATMTSEDIRFEISEAVNGKQSITTTTGFIFDDTGLHISNNTSDVSTTIKQDGMYVENSDKTELLTANSEGVRAVDLHATTFLVIGNNSRLQDYENGSRTACYWIGG